MNKILSIPLRMLKAAVALVFCMLLQSLASGQFTSGNVVVLQVGDGTTPVSGTSYPIILKEYSPSGTAVQDVAVPTSGANQLTISATSTSEGGLFLSEDGLYLTLAGYDAPSATANVNATAANRNRVLGFFVNNETFARPFSSTAATSHTNNNIRGGAYDGTRAYTFGAGGATTGGARYFDSNTTSLQLSSTITNLRWGGIFGGQVYASVNSGANLGIVTVGTGLPTTTGNTISLLINMGTGASPYGFFFNSTRTICYIADDRTGAGGGIQKWTASSPTGPWTLQYTVSMGASTGARGVAVNFAGTNPVVYATTTANRLVSFTDTGVSSTVTTLATAATNYVFRGVAFSPITATSFTYYEDLDGDTYGSSVTITSASATPPAGYSAVSGDCNDAVATINPGVVESIAQANVCDDLDNDCDTAIDETSVAGCNDPLACNYNAAATCTEGCDFSAITWYIDADGDGFGNAASSVSACANPGGYVLNNTDCNDAVAAINPSIVESAAQANLCDDIDNDCDTQIDELAVDGCTNNTASNFNPAATCDNGSCLFTNSFSSGNLVVLQVGNGSTALSNASAALTLREFSTSGTAVQSVTVPSSGADRLTISGSASSEGALSRSENGLYLTIAGYDSNTGVASINSTAGVNRVVGYMVNNETWARPFSVAQTDAFNTNNIRSAYYDGTRTYAAGTATTSSLGGVRYFTSNTSTVQVSSTVTNIRVTRVFGGQLYASASSGANIGILQVGTGTPTASGNTATLLINAGTGASPYAFYFNSNRTICYVADDRASAAGGIQKWTASTPAGPWTLAYTLAVGTNIGARGVTVDFSGANPIVYATTNDNRLVRIVDAGAGSTFTLLATAATNFAFRGVDFAPEANALFTYYEDLDGDGYGSATSILSASVTAPAGYASLTGDCNDTVAAINPEVTEAPAQANVCDGVDNDCDTTIDEGFVTGCNNATACNYNPLATCEIGCDFTPVSWYVDADGDGYGDNSTVVSDCVNPGGYILVGNDCDDTNGAVNPGVTEGIAQNNICDGLDNDCDLVIDPLRVNGCTDNNALNYNPAATCDNGGCTYPSGFGVGNLLVTRSGSGAAALNSNATAIFLDEYLPATANQASTAYTFSVPSTGSNRLTNSGTATSNLQMNRATDGLSVVIAGLDAAAGTASITSSTAAAINRVVGELGINLNWSRPIVSSVFYSGDNFRAVAKDGSNFWGAGNSLTTGGINYLGTAQTAANVSNVPANTRVVKIVNGELYFSTGSTTPGIGIYKIGTGLPTTSTAATAVINMGTVSGPSPYDFDFSPALNVCYVADDRFTTGVGGVQKWVLNSGSWSLAYTISVGTSSGARSIYVDYYSEAFPVIYAITAPATGQSRLVRVSDTGITNPTLTILATAPTNTAFRAVELAPCYDQVWYRDADADGFGNSALIVRACTQPLGYVLQDGDCDDTNDLVYPLALEDCDNLDNDCDLIVDDACVPVPDNNIRSRATAVEATTYPSCLGNTLGVDLTYATSSPESSLPLPIGAGQDVWYRFVANSTTVRIAVTSSQNNISVELQNEAGVSLATENALTSVGNETLVHTGLTVGATYFVVVRNLSDTQVGTATVCIQRLNDSRCNNGGGNNLSGLCVNFKVAYTGANNYVLSFTEIPTVADPVVDVFTYTTPGAGTTVPLSAIVGLNYGRQYDVSVATIYNLSDAAGGFEVVNVPSDESCVVSVAAQPELNLRVSDSAPNQRFTNSTIAANRWICGASYYRWAITPLTPVAGLTQFVNGPAGNRFLPLASANAQFPGLIQPGATYNIQVAPIFGSIEGNFGVEDQVLMIAGSSMPVVEEEWNSFTERSFESDAIVASLYPNPNAGDLVNLAVSGLENAQVMVRVLDAQGRVVMQSSFAVDGVLNTSIAFERALNNGLYMIEIVDGSIIRTERMVVQK